MNHQKQRARLDSWLRSRTCPRCRQEFAARVFTHAVRLTCSACGIERYINRSDVA